MPGTLAEKLGLVAGDVLLTVGGAPIVSRAELETMMRVSAGADVEVEWAHGDEKLAATGTLCSRVDWLSSRPAACRCACGRRSGSRRPSR